MLDKVKPQQGRHQSPTAPSTASGTLDSIACISRALVAHLCHLWNMWPLSLTGPTWCLKRSFKRILHIWHLQYPKISIATLAFLLQLQIEPTQNFQGMNPFQHHVDDTKFFDSLRSNLVSFHGCRILWMMVLLKLEYSSLAQARRLERVFFFFSHFPLSESLKIFIITLQLKMGGFYPPTYVLSKCKI